MLHCKAKTIGGFWNPTKINLDSFISNKDGKLDGCGKATIKKYIKPKVNKPKPVKVILPKKPKVVLPKKPKVPKIHLPKRPKVVLPGKPKVPKLKLPGLPGVPRPKLPGLPGVPRPKLPGLPGVPRPSLPSLPQPKIKQNPFSNVQQQAEKVGKAFCVANCVMNPLNAQKRCLVGSNLMPCKRCTGIPSKNDPSLNEVCGAVCNSILPSQPCDFYGYLNNKRKAFDPNLLTKYGLKILRRRFFRR